MSSRKASRVPGVLFLCGANSARSIMAESVLNALGGGRFRAYSAGSNPSGQVHPQAFELLERNGYPTAGLRSKGVDEFTGAGAPRIDFVISLCDADAGEPPPALPGRPVIASWNVADPAVATGSGDDSRRAFEQALGTIRRRVQSFTGLPFESVDPAAMGGPLREIGER